jgi:acyl-CoA synthetase (AMP-forming)/AMP-acid ligase II
MMTTGYWLQPEATAQTVVDGWYRTGDLGRRDAQGLYYVVDRVKDMIITGGENVYSVEVERALAEHEAVASVAVVGTPDVRWGEKVTAFVVLHPGADASAEDLRLHCRGLIANYKVPKVIHLQEALPMTASGKIQKATLRQLSAESGG